MANIRQKAIVKLPPDMIEKIVAGIEQFGRVKVTGLGIFSTKTIAGHPGRHPVTNEIVEFPPHVRIKFKPTTSLYDRVQKDGHK